MPISSPVLMSVVTRVELEGGVYRDPVHAAVRRARLDTMLVAIPALACDVRSARKVEPGGRRPLDAVSDPSHFVGMSRPLGLATVSPAGLDTRQHLIDTGLRLMLEQGYSALGVQELLDESGVTKGSFYHHFGSKEVFALAVIDAYQANVHTLLDAVLADRSVPPLQRVRRFFAAVGEAYESEGYLGCLLGGLGQELSGTSEVFRLKIEGCVAAIASRLALCLEEARVRGDLPMTSDPSAAADIIVNAWEGAALRSRLLRSGRPLKAVLDFCLAGMSAH